MCDYSLTGVPNRLAVEGEELITYRFPTGSIGLASPGEVRAQVECTEADWRGRPGFWETIKFWLAGPQKKVVCAVCIAPGSILQMSKIPEQFSRQFALNATEEVTFTQLTAEPFQYRDAVRFRNGRHALLQALREGISFKVISDGTDRSVHTNRGTREPARRANVQCIAF
jgi:hypothetical protein